jgi:hypothetical protein
MRIFMNNSFTTRTSAQTNYIAARGGRQVGIAGIVRNLGE